MRGIKGILDIKQGNIYGCYLALESSGDSPRQRVTARCVFCGFQQNLLPDTLLSREREQKRRGAERGCRHCQPGNMAKARPSPHCLKCEGLSHRRPLRGLCSCGEKYAEEDTGFDYSASRGGLGQIMAGGALI